MIREGGFSSQRSLISGMDDIADVVNDQRVSIPLPPFSVAIVIDVIYDPTNLSDDQKNKLKEIILNSEIIDRIPRNSIIASIITRSVNKSDNVYQIFFPCNQHDVSPIKPGEQAFVFFADQYRSKQIGYWLCRVPEPLDSDDINFTHPDRKFEYQDGLSTIERMSGASISPPGFLNGDGTSDETLTTVNYNDFDKINSESLANSVVIKEPVARFTKRPGDKLIQGSNGSRIVLGQYRNGSVNNTPVAGSPSIDIVTNSHSNLNENVEPTGNQPRVIKNTRNELEVDKNPKKKNKKDNTAEGDPDFINDQSRFLITSKGNIDQDFQINIGDDRGETSGAILKSNVIRIIGNTDIKIISGGSSIIINSDGDIIIESDGKIKLGGSDASLAVGRVTDPVMVAENMNQWIIKVSAMLTTLGIIFNTPGPLVGAPGTFTPGNIPSAPPSDFGKIKEGSEITVSK